MWSYVLAGMFCTCLSGARGAAYGFGHDLRVSVLFALVVSTQGFWHLLVLVVGAMSTFWRGFAPCP